MRADRLRPRRAPSPGFGLGLACAAAVVLVATARAQDAASPVPAPASAPTPALVPVPASTSALPAAAADPREAAVQAAVDRLRADPLLGQRHKKHTLQWKSDASETSDDDGPFIAALIRWLIEFFRFVNDTSRLLLYALAATLFAVLVVGLRRLVRLRGGWRLGKRPAAVSHVRDLDVRPESLPDDIGAAAWTLWRSGEVTAALSLLYRGALSRLIHRHAVPIESSTTEGECLALARGRLAPPALDYLARLVRAWEANTYGQRTPSAALGEALCRGFAPGLDAPPAPAADTAAAATEAAP